MYSCGQSEYQLMSDSENIEQDTGCIEELYTPTISSSSIKLYTAYLGEVSFEAPNDDKNIYLQKIHKINGTSLLVKVIDAQKYNININKRYNLNTLKTYSCSSIDIRKNKYTYLLTLLTTKKMYQLSGNNTKISTINKLIEKVSNKELEEKVQVEYPSLVLTSHPNLSLTSYKRLYKQFSEYNSAVDIFYNTINYLDFLYRTSGIISVNNLDSIISIAGVPNLDNAFFTGQYMVYGNGDRNFYPLTSIDVIGHELSHGLVSGTAGLEYKGHSGALNESFSDIMGTMFEFYMYETHTNLLGEKDWTVGEDLGMTHPFLRSMENPNKGRQPDNYKGKHYLNPNSRTDYGGVHINSGITNYCFYLASQKQDKKLILTTFLDCLKNLSKTSNFMDFRDQLKISSDNNPIILECLNTVGLDTEKISDYNPSGDGIKRTIPPIKFPRPKLPKNSKHKEQCPTVEPCPSCCHHCPHHCSLIKH